MGERISTWAAAVPAIFFGAAMSCAGPLPDRPDNPKPVSTRLAPKPACSRTVVRGVPSLCVPADGSGHFVVGLPPRHAFQRGAWVVAEIDKPGVNGAFPVAVLVVTEASDDFARVRPVCQREPVSLNGAAARAADQKTGPRVGKCVGHIARQDSGAEKLDIGLRDDVQKGDVFEVRPAGDLLAPPIGRVRVSGLEEGIAWTTALDSRAPTPEGRLVVFSRGAEEEASFDGSARAIVVADVDRPDAQDPLLIERERALAIKLKKAIESAAEGMSKIVVQHELEKRVGAARSDEEALESARSIGNLKKADLVVWGTTASCPSDACLTTRLTVLDPETRTERSFMDMDRWARCDTAGFTFKEAPPATPSALAAAILGSATYEAQRYGDASYYLEQALREGVLRGADELEARFKLAHALGARGQTAAARELVHKLIERAGEVKQDHWAHCGQNELALLDWREGDVESARARLLAARRAAEAKKDAGELGFAVHTLASLEMHEGRVDIARSHFEESMRLARRARDVAGEAVTLHQLANIEAVAGEGFRARYLYEDSLKLSESIRDARWQAVTLHQLANLEAKEGNLALARDHYDKSLQLNPLKTNRDAWAWATTRHQIGNLLAKEKKATRARESYEKSLGMSLLIDDTAGQAAVLAQLANLEEEVGRPEQARSYYNRLLKLKKRVRDVGGEAYALNDLALLESEHGTAELARSLFHQSLELKKSVGDVPGQVVTHVNLASLDLLDGKPIEARRRLDEALSRARALGLAEYQARSLNWLGMTDRFEGSFAAARERCEVIEQSSFSHSALDQPDRQT